MPVRHSLLGSLPSAAVEPVELPTPVIDGVTSAGSVAAAAAAAGSGPPVQHGRLRKCATAVTLHERRSGGMSGRLLRSLAPSRASLSASVTVVRPLRHAVTLSSLEQARQSAGCTRCGSQQTLRLPAERRATCRVCLSEVPAVELHRLSACGCRFCRECMSTYASVCVDNGETLVPCPEPLCPSGGRLTADEIRDLTDEETFRRYQRVAYIREVERDPGRVWCPRPGCDTACTLAAGGQPFACSGCGGRFCAVCRRSRSSEPEDTPHECRPERWLLGGSQLLGGAVKKCPHCGVPIEREDGCAQMMCRRCRHTFCWYCLASLDGDLFLRHYDSGPCRRLLGHSRGSLIWHRVQLVGALIGVGLMFVVAAPVLILYAPVVMCTSCQCDPNLELDTVRAEGTQQLASPQNGTPPPD